MGNRHAFRHALLIMMIFAITSQAAFHELKLFTPKAPSVEKRRSSLIALQSSGGAIPEEDHGPKFSAMLGNLRIPSSLFAGASAGAAFAMPIAASDSIKEGFVKRIYSLLMMSSLASQLLVITISTVNMNLIARTVKGEKLATSTTNYIEKFFLLEWTATKFHFFSGVLAFVVGAGLRAWTTIGCPIVARAALGIIASSTALAMTFLNSLWEEGGEVGVLKLPFTYVSLLWKKCRRSVAFALAMIVNVVTALYIIGNIPHVYKYLVS
mmetsp:Transcript_18525/g.27998  ORF Transcript_18525/g.27998 Transcript_18525/m.27998 type:complete len:267 (-) Transcript_18525:4-804(-)